LTTQNEVHQKELESHRLKEIREAETESAIEEVKQKKQTEAIEFKVTQESRRKFNLKSKPHSLGTLQS